MDTLRAIVNNPFKKSFDEKKKLESIWYVCLNNSFQFF